MRPNTWLILAISCGVLSWYAAPAQCHVSAGVMLLRHDTDLKVDTASDFDGSDNTAEQRAKDWDVLGSAAGVRISYEFPKLVAVYGEGGIAQATVRDKDVTDIDQDVRSRGLDDGTYYGVGARLGGDFSPTSTMFWQVNGGVSVVSTSLDQDINTSWDYDETQVQFGGKVGKWAQKLGFYGGARFVQSTANLDETNRTNPIGLQTRTVELGRDGDFDVLLGAQTRQSDVAGFAEIGLVGTFSANAGLTIGF